MRQARPAIALVSVATLTGLAACGSAKQEAKSSGGGATAETERTNGMTVADEAALPKCDDTREGFLVYVTATKTFEACSGGQWAKIDLKGPQGDKGDAGAKGADGANEIQQALALYKDYKRGVFRASLSCTLVSPRPSGCVKADGVTPLDGNIGLLGSAFLCGEKEICTNAHVIDCDSASPQNVHCYNIQHFELLALPKTGDSLNAPDGGESAPFFQTSNETSFKVHASLDLAKIVLTTVPAAISDVKPLPLADAAAGDTVAALTPMLSLSFPLGFQDLYTDVGYVNTPVLGECDQEGGVSGYGCPKALYVFSTTNDTDHGSSGSPLFDLTTGKVRGVTSAGTDQENANYTWASDAFELTNVK